MKKLIPLVGASASLVIVFGTIYAVGQQIQRSDANWPQIQMAEDAALAINKGSGLPQAGPSVELDKSLAPFTNVYDLNGKVVNGSGMLNGTVATPPKGLLSAADSKTYSAVTWQPQSGVRIAAVTVRTKDYYVLSGRSLSEVEKNETRTFLLSFVGGASTLFVSILTLWAYGLVKKRASRKK